MYFNKSLIISKKSQKTIIGGEPTKTKKINLIHCHTLRIPWQQMGMERNNPTVSKVARKRPEKKTH